MANSMKKMMSQAHKAQQQMEFAQSQLDKQEFIGQSPENLVTATMTGKRQMKDVKVNPKVVEDGDLGMLNDLVVSAVNDAEKNITKQTKETLGKYTKGIPK